MKTPLISFLASLCFSVLGLSAAQAQDLTPPKVAHPLHNLKVPAGAAPRVIDLTDTFRLEGVTGTIVRMTTVLGDIDIQMYSAQAPLNVANFLSYVNSHAYDETFIHRSIVNPPFVIQGGGYSLNSAGNSVAVAAHAPVTGEHSISNSRGTLALALSSGPNSGTNEWFFNLADNTQLDPAGTQEGGPFTVFGRVIEADMSTIDAIAALPTQDLGNGSQSDPFTDVPLYNYSASKGFTDANLVYLTRVAVIPLVPPSTGVASVLKLTVKNSDPSLVQATLSGHKLRLVYRQDKTGSAIIRVFAADSAGNRVQSEFTVTVK